MRKFFSLVIVLIVAVSVGNDLYARPADNPFKYLSPRPDARFITPQSVLIFRPGDELARDGISWTSSVRVEGERSGVHDGRWIVADDATTIIFKPYRNFDLGENVTVSVSVGETERDTMQRSVYSYRFEIAPRVVPYEPDYEEILAIDRGSVECLDVDSESRSFLAKREHGDLVLPIDFPNYSITTCNDPGDGYVFLSNIVMFPGPTRACYIMILENDGFPVFFRRMRRTAYDFKKQPNGMLSYLMGGTQHYFTMDNTYTVVDSFTSQNGYAIDVHEFQILPNGHVIFIADDPRIIDMSQYVEGGDTAATVVGNVLQELDQSKNLVFQWRTFDHLDFMDSNFNLTARIIRYAHVNAIEPDHDGNIIISCRHLSEITKIDRQTGDVIWRMGGKKNEFTLENDTQWFSRQHDIRRLPDGNITLYDNGNLNKPRESRAVEYELDEVNKIATLVWEYRNDPLIYGAAMGNAQRLPGGNTVIGWGSAKPSVTEVHMDGSKAFELYLPGWQNTYRAFRFPWEGIAAEPYLWAEADSDSQRLRLHFTRFGDDGVVKYYVYRGDSPEPTKKVAVTTGHSVEMYNFAADDTLYFRVTSVDRHGNESPFSNELKIVPNFSRMLPLVYAGLNVTPSTLNVSSEGRWITAHIEFSGESGYRASDVDESTIMLNDTVLVDPYGNGEDGDEKGNNKKLTVKFPREEVIDILPEDENALIKVSGIVGENSFECFDTIRVVRPDDIGIFAEPAKSEPVQAVDHRNFPNPFNPSTIVSFTLPAPMHVLLSVYDVQGRHVVTLVDRFMDEGVQKVQWNGRNAHGEQVVSGIYFYRLVTANEVFTRKIVLLR